MCCLFGLLDYKKTLSLDQRKKILRTLSIACEARGTDATGIAYFTGKRLYIQKAPRAAHRMRFRLGQNARFIMGHTRMTTQGDEKRNFNNHPFSGKAGGMAFALAHNGVIYNDKELQRKYDLPATKIETDSYVAVQLLEQAQELDFQSLAAMAEALRGSFTITVLDQQNNLYIIKGNNPICIYHFEQLGFYLYASTHDILQEAIDSLGLAEEPYQLVAPKCGDIVRIGADGSVVISAFNDEALCFLDSTFHWDWEDYCSFHTAAVFRAEDHEAEMLEDYASISGVDRDVLELLRNEGYNWLEIEDLLYDRDLLEACVGELLLDAGTPVENTLSQ